MGWKNAKQMNEFFVFENEGDSIEGKVIKAKTINTEYGEAVAIDLKPATGDERTIIQSAGMGDLEQYKGCLIKVTFKGLKKNEKTKRYYKDFEVLVDEDDLARVNSDLPF